MADLQYSKQASKYLARMHKSHARKMRRILQDIAAGSNKAANIKYMKNQNAYRLRLGNFRAMFVYRNDGKLIVVIKVGTRGDFYK